MEQLIQTMSIIATVIGATFYFSREIKSDVNAIHARIDAETARVDAQMARIDQLYAMFVDLLKREKNL